jgi:hypothetical protein
LNLKRFTAPQALRTSTAPATPNHGAAFPPPPLPPAKGPAGPDGVSETLAPGVGLPLLVGVGLALVAGEPVPAAGLVGVAVFFGVPVGLGLGFLLGLVLGVGDGHPVTLNEAFASVPDTRAPVGSMMNA